MAVDDGALYVAFSPDGSRVAYTAKRGDVTDLFVADLDGGSPIEIASGPMGWGVDWSPDGSRIVFSNREKRQNGTYWVSSDGSEEGMIAPFTPGAGKTPEPPPSLIGVCDQRDEQGVAQPGKGCASPDGQFIAFSGVLIESGRAPITSLVVIDSATGTQTDITPEGVDRSKAVPPGRRTAAASPFAAPTTTAAGSTLSRQTEAT